MNNFFPPLPHLIRHIPVLDLKCLPKGKIKKLPWEYNPNNLEVIIHCIAIWITMYSTADLYDTCTWLRATKRSFQPQFMLSLILTTLTCKYQICCPINQSAVNYMHFFWNKELFHGLSSHCQYKAYKFWLARAVRLCELHKV